jgi:hypothetical protein
MVLAPTRILVFHLEISNTTFAHRHHHQLPHHTPTMNLSSFRPVFRPFITPNRIPTAFPRPAQCLSQRTPATTSPFSSSSRMQKRAKKGGGQDPRISTFLNSSPSHRHQLFALVLTQPQHQSATTFPTLSPRAHSTSPATASCATGPSTAPGCSSCASGARPRNASSSAST